MLLSVPGGHFHPFDKNSKGSLLLPEPGLKALLGPCAELRVRESLAVTLGVEPSSMPFECGSASTELCRLVCELVPLSSCSCPSRPCFTEDALVEACSRRCKVAGLWESIRAVIVKGIAATFIAADKDVSVDLDNYSAADGLLHVIKPQPQRHPWVSNQSIHVFIMGLLNTTHESKQLLGKSSLSCSIFPSTLFKPELNSPPSIQYSLLDGLFHDGTNYYPRIETDRQPIRTAQYHPALESIAMF
jgi:hypothetical protein